MEKVKENAVEESERYAQVVSDKFKKLGNIISTSKWSVDTKRMLNDDITTIVDVTRVQQRLIMYLIGQNSILSKSKETSYAEIVKRTPDVKTRLIKRRGVEANVIKIVPEKEQTSEKTKEQIQQLIDPEKLEIGISTCRKAHNGGIVIGSEKEGDLDKLIAEFTVNDKLKNNYRVEKPPRRKPHIIIYGIIEKYENEEFIRKLAAQNGELRNADIDVVTKYEMNNAQNWIITLDGDAFKRVEKLKRLKLDWERFRFREYLKPVICYNCWAYGHIAKHCSRDKRCKICGDIHDDKEECKKVMKCVNCTYYFEKEGLVDLKRSGSVVEHLPTDRNCPRYKLEIRRVISRTYYGSHKEACPKTEEITQEAEGTSRHGIRTSRRPRTYQDDIDAEFEVCYSY